MRSHSPFPFKGFPWATLGRRETSAEFFKKHGEQLNRAQFFKRRPLISFVVIVREDVNEDHFADCVTSLRMQSYGTWEATFVASPKVRRLESVMTKVGDRRMRWSEGTVAEAVAEAKGEYVAFPEADAVVSPVALFLLLIEPEADVLYANEATIDGTPPRLTCFLSRFEPSELNLLHFDAVGNFALVRRALWEPTASSHALYLHLLEKKASFQHAPYFLYYRRSASSRADVEAVRAYLGRSGVAAEVSSVDEQVKVRLEIAQPTGHLVSAIIPFRDRAEWTVRCLEALRKQVGRVPLEVVLVNNDSTSEDVAKVTSAMESLGVPARMVNFQGAFNYAQIHNVAVTHCRGDLLLLLNNDVFLRGGPFLDEMVGWALRPSTGTVGICLRYAHGEVQHSGIRARAGGEARIARVGNFASDDEWVSETREVFANTFAACLFRREHFEKVGGLRARDLPNGFGDVAFNFELLRRGLHNLYLGHLEGVHLESASRGFEYEYWEERIIEREYPEILQRMLRQDLGYNLVPEAEFSVPAFLRGALAHGIRTKAPWLDPLKPPVKKLLRSFRAKADNRTDDEHRT